MVAYSFAPRFAGLVESGQKTHTIRKYRQGRSRHARPGEPVQLYTGMRTKHCRKLVDPDPVCLGVYDVSLNFVGPGCAWLDGEIISNLDAFARDDGFKGWSDMDGWWVETHATALFDGVLIRWGNR